MNNVTHPLSSGDVSIFQQKLAISVISRNTDVDVDCVLIHNL